MADQYEPLADFQGKDLPPPPPPSLPAPPPPPAAETPIPDDPNSKIASNAPPTDLRTNPHFALPAGNKTKKVRTPGKSGTSLEASQARNRKSGNKPSEREKSKANNNDSEARVLKSAEPLISAFSTPMILIFAGIFCYTFAGICAILFSIVK